MCTPKNGFYILENEDRVKYQALINKLQNITSLNDNIDVIHEIQTILVKTMARVTRETLNTVIYDEITKITPKVILIAHFNDVIFNLMNELKEFNPIVYMNNYDTTCNIDKFTQSNADNRVLISKSHYLQGFDLSDTTGTFPRFMYKMPMPRLNEDKSLMCRINYRNVGKATFRIFHGHMEQIVNPLATKEYDNEYENL